MIYKKMSKIKSSGYPVTVEEIEMKNADFVEGRWIEFQVIGKQKLNPWFSIFNWSVFNWAKLCLKRLSQRPGEEGEEGEDEEDGEDEGE